MREILSIEKLDFNQLLQRDLDDHRVATELIPYVLEPEQTGPAFFPPLIAVILPFEANEPVEHLPQHVNEGVVMSEGLPYKTTRYGEAFQAQRLVDKTHDPHPLNVGRLSWNDEMCKLVVIDGQHRAMALLAIDRTVNSSWSNDGGSKYRYFYEHRVKDLLKDKSIDLGNIEFPVNICWFPDTRNPHKASRKLFVDLNKEARQPSEARLILLSDRELTNIFSRSVLNRLRSEKSEIDVHCVEYDNPDENNYQPVRWSVVTNLHFIKYAIQYSLFCPDKYIRDMNKRFGGALPWSEMNGRMRRQLDLDEVMPEKFDDGENFIERASVGNEYFPQSKVDELADRFMASWGEAIIKLFSEIRPYRAHCDALEELREQWISDDAISSLAYEALFAGMGMYWTLRDSHEYWQQRKRELRAQGKKTPSKPDIVKAWKIIERKQDDFEARRAYEYLGSVSEARKKETKELFSVMNTHACQLGAVLTLTTLVDEADLNREEIASFTEKVCRAWSLCFESKVNSNRDRKLVFVGNEEIISNPINRISRMDTPIAVHFRYFWLELLCVETGIEALPGKIDPETIIGLRDRARVNYLRYLVKEQKKALKRSNPEWSNEKIASEALKVESNYLSKSLDFWFDQSEGQFNTWLEDFFFPSIDDVLDNTEATQNGDDENTSTNNDEVDEILRNITESS